MSSHIFISYSHKDSNIANRVVNALGRAKVPFFIDRVALHPGESLTSKIGEGLEQAKALIVLISESSVSSEWVKNELRIVKNLNIQIIPLRCDKTEWPASLQLILGDSLYIDGDDLDYAIGIVPKLFPGFYDSEPRDAVEQFFPLRSEGAFCPHVQIFSGTLQTAWDEKRFGRIAVVLPTNEGINLAGKVTTSFLEHLGISAGGLRPSLPRISSREVSILNNNESTYTDLVLMASTVFNSSYEPHAEDQWRAAGATLDCAESQKCSLVLVPPLGTGSFDWPVRQAVVNWLYGAIRWSKNNVMATNKSVWPIICVPGPGDQKILSYYFSGLTKTRLSTLESRMLTIRVRYKGEESDEIAVRHDILLGAIAKSAFPSLKSGTYRFRHGAGLVRKHSKIAFDYSADTPIAKTIFADGDIIDVY